MNIRQNFGFQKRGIVPDQLKPAAMRPNFRRRRDKQLQRRIGGYDRANIAAIEYRATRLMGKVDLKLFQGGANGGEARDL